jgi:hypothetical protein
MSKLVSSNTLVSRQRDRIWVARRSSCSARTPCHDAPLLPPADFPLTPGPSPPASSLLGERGDRVVLFRGDCIDRAKCVYWSTGVASASVWPIERR